MTFNSIGIVGSVTWMPFGGINTWSTSAGVTFTRSFDEDYRITSLALVSFNTQGLTWDVALAPHRIDRNQPLREILRLRQPRPPDRRDHRDRLTHKLDLRRQRQPHEDDRPQQQRHEYNYTADTNILASLSGHVAQTFTTDGAGNMTGDGTNTWTYDQRGRMATKAVCSTTTTYLINDPRTAG